MIPKLPAPRLRKLVGNSLALWLMTQVAISGGALAQTATPKKTVRAGRNAFITTTTVEKKSVTTTPGSTQTVPAPGSYSNSGAAVPATSTSAPPPPGSAPGVPAGAVTSAPPAAAPAPPRSPWRLVYFGDYIGPRLSNLRFSQTQGPQAATTSYTAWNHSVKGGYQIAPNHIIGMQVRAQSPFDPTQQFFFKNLRFYATWQNMVDTKDVNIGTVIDLEPGTSTGARTQLNSFNLNFKINWELKTQLRNWSFTAMTLFRTMFYDQPSGKGDFYVGLFPWVTMDLGPNWQLLFEGSFDASHSYNDVFFQLGQDDPDYVNVGVIHSFSPHLQINPALRFYTDNISFKAADLYLSVTAAL